MHGFNALGKKSLLIFQGTTDFERERKRIAMCNCMRNPYGVTMVCGCACGMLSCFCMCDTFQICQCNVDQGGSYPNTPWYGMGGQYGCSFNSKENFS